MKVHNLLGAACVAALAGTAVAGGELGLDAGQALMQRHPGVRAWDDGARTRIFYGAPMTTARTARAAAERFIADHGEAFGAGELTLVETWAGDVRYGKFWAFSYTQTLDGLAVDTSPGRVLVRDNLDGTWSVVYAAGLFAELPEGGFPAMAWTGQDALNFIRGTEDFGQLPKWSKPELVAWQPTGGASNEAVRAWKFVGENPDLVKREKYTFFVDAANGAVLEARDGVHNADVFGFVKGYASPGRLPDEGGNPPVLLPVNNANVAISGGGSGYSDAAGFFDIAHGGGSNVTITSDFDVGQWSNINDQSGTAVLEVSATATPGVEAYLEFNSAPSQFKTAQVNAFIHTGLIHNFIRDRCSWTGMDFRCQTNVNISSSCNAYFDGGSINFFRAQGGCNNTAYSTVVAHEYGHYIVQNQGLGQGAFGEGYGDCCAELLYDTHIIGEHFTTGGGFIRNNDSVRKYPCSGEAHSCGQLLGGVWWHMRENFGATYGSGPGLDEVRQLFVDWTLITTGGQGDNSAHPGTAIEVLTLDDDDGNISNGTPNWDDIVAAFELHEVPTPEIVPLVFLYPDGLPELVSPAGGTSFRVQVLPNTGFEPQPGTGVLHVDAGTGYAEFPMTELSENVYLAEFEAYDCRTELSFYVSAETTDGTVGSDPIDAPDESYGAFAAESRALLVDADFETDAGFTVTDDGQTSGAWSRATPIGNNGGNPTSDYDGSGKCFLTGFLSFQDLDGGPTRLTSPAYDLSGLSDPTLSYARWFHNSNPQEEGDRLVVEVSADFGVTWHEVESVGHQGNQWTPVVVHISDYVPLTSGFMVRFSANDSGADSLTEAGIDALLIEEVDCGGCVADFNGDGDVNTQDMLAFLNAWSAGDDSADVNGDGVVNSQDVLFFLNLWNAGC